MTALAYDRTHLDPELQIDPIDEFIDELFAATPRRRHLSVVTDVPVTPGHDRHAGHDAVAPAPTWSDPEQLAVWTRDYQPSDDVWRLATPRRARVVSKGLVRLFLRTFQLVVLLGVALAMVVSMFPVSVDAVDTTPETTTHVVQEGDTLWNLAEQITPAGADIGATIAVIKAANDLPSSMLVPGDQIVIPAHAG